MSKIADQSTRSLEAVSLHSENPEQPSESSPRRRNRYESLYSLRVSYEAPLTMLGMLFAGGALAVGHHLFYSSLNGDEVPQGDDHNWGQQLNTSLGTGFAFLVKTSLISAVAAAYTQYIWFDFRSNYSRVSTIDSKFMALSSIFSMLDPAFIGKSKIGAVLALLTWSVYNKLLAAT